MSATAFQRRRRELAKQKELEEKQKVEGENRNQEELKKSVKKGKIQKR